MKPRSDSLDDVTKQTPIDFDIKLSDAQKATLFHVRNKEPFPALTDEFKRNHPIKVIVASKSAIKIAAVANALNNSTKYQITGIDAPSKINEQPLNHETTTGAINRIDNAMKADNTADIYIAIENGVYEHEGKILDKAVIWMKCRRPDNTFTDHMTITQSVEFPKECFDIAKERGFSKTTVADMMLEKGLIEDSKDPHKNLGNKTPRGELLLKALKQMDIESKRQKALTAPSGRPPCKEIIQPK